jgi:hypothetical protein
MCSTLFLAAARAAALAHPDGIGVGIKGEVHDGVVIQQIAVDIVLLPKGVTAEAPSIELQRVASRSQHCETG